MKSFLISDSESPFDRRVEMFRQMYSIDHSLPSGSESQPSSAEVCPIRILFIVLHGGKLFVCFRRFRFAPFTSLQLRADVLAKGGPEESNQTTASAAAKRVASSGRCYYCWYNYQGCQSRPVCASDALESKLTPLQLCTVPGVVPLNLLVKVVFAF